MKGDARRMRGAGSAGATRKVIAFYDAKTGTERWVPTGLVAGGSVGRTWRNYVPSRTEPAPIRSLRDGGGRAGQFRSTRLSPVVFPKEHKVFEKPGIGDINLVGDLKAGGDECFVPGAKAPRCGCRIELAKLRI